MTITGSGIDIIEIDRIKKVYQKYPDRFLKRLFTEKERLYCQNYKNPLPHLAGRFAAKEAIVKALREGLQEKLLHWQDIEIVNDKAGRPEVFFSSRLKNHFVNCRVLLSISHCRNYAVANAICVEIG